MGPAAVRAPLPRLPRGRSGTARRWVVVVVAATVLAVVVGRSVARAEAARSRWSDAAPVLVVTKAVPVDGPLAPAVAVARWPADLIPAGALTDPVDLPADARAAGALGPGMPVTASALRSAPEDRRQEVGVPIGPTSLPVSVGATVSVWATWDPSLAAGASRTEAVCDDATVVRVEEQVVVIAVRSDDVAGVVDATALATVTLVAEDP